LFSGKNEDGPFVWSQPIQALISTSFLWGYITTNIPGGRLAEVVGTKYLLTGSMLLTSVLTVLVPPAAYLGWQYVVFIRILMGIALVGVIFLGCIFNPSRRKCRGGLYLCHYQ
jgi:MFS family permease